MRDKLVEMLSRRGRRKRLQHPTTDWAREELFVSGEIFFKRLIQEISEAKSSVWLEYYILKDDLVGSEVLAALREARQRGIDTRIHIDGAGSQDWISRKYTPELAAEFGLKVYKPLPFLRAVQELFQLKFSRVLRLLKQVNRRSHRKLAIIDKRIAFVGSMNLCAESVEAVYGNLAWRDTSVAVEGDALPYIVESYEAIWTGRLPKRRERLKGYSPLIRDNRSLVRRLESYRELLESLRNAKARIFVTTAYFVPQRGLRRALREAARRGIDVRIIVPACSDVFFLPWVSRHFYGGLMRAGAQVFEYQPSMIHSKTIIIDDQAWIGSSNLNNRSLYWDMEMDVLTKKENTIKALVAQFEEDQSHALRSDKSQTEGFTLTRFLGYLFLRFTRIL